MNIHRALLPSVLLLITVLAIPHGDLLCSAEGFEQTVRFDLDTDDGGFVHGGTNDPWEWGVPGEGNPEEPWPGSAMGGAWGAPLNGTYPNGTDAYLELPEMDTTLLSSLHISFHIWYDLSSSGQTLGHDGLKVMTRTPEEDWHVLQELSGSSEGVWEELNISLEDHIGGALTIRFHLTDLPDGLQGRGVVLDDIVLYGAASGPVPVHFSRQSAYPTYLSAFDTAYFSFFLAGGPLDRIGEASVRIMISTTGERVLLDRTMTVTPSMLGENTIRWTPDEVGQFWVEIVLLGAGTEGSEEYFIAYAVDALTYDDMAKGTGPYTLRTEQGNASWSSPNSVTGCLSLSRGQVLKAGSGTSSTEGFSGICLTTVESDWLDLAGLGTAFLSIHHALESSGPASTCGAVLELMEDGLDWVLIAPIGDDTAYDELGANTGPLAGKRGFTGPYDWKETVFALEGLTEGRTKLRVSLTSGKDGKGGGLFLDDILLWGEAAQNDTTPPPQVSGLEFSVTGDGRVSFSWDPSEADDLMLYRVYAGTGTFGGLDGLDPQLEVPSYETSALLTGLDPKVLHWAAVTAVDLTGNEDRNVNTISFTPALTTQNRPPVAIIDSQYGTQRRLGEDFIFDGSRSSDPDNDHLTFLWKFPDGSSDRGARTRWRSASEGTGLIVRLTVTDSKGASSNVSITIDVLPEDGDLIQTGDLAQFLICLLPLLLIVFLIVIILILLRKSRMYRLRERLKEAGIEIVGPKDASRPLPGPTGKVGKVPDRQRVLDLVPAKRPAKVPSTLPVRPKPVPKTPLARPSPPPRAEAKMASTRAIPLVLEPTPPPSPPRGREMIKVTLECPFCGGIFKEHVDKDAMKKGALENIVCPECGRKGEIIS
ncbi:MAG: PKD domain-containing protein [Candidatus Thermoplasmatota archaeon]|nr:PKD domain-containing protein [Candidatus Thermoplasmatota archaeon]